MNTFLKSGDQQEGYDCISQIVQLGDFFYFSGQCGWGRTFHEQCVNACYQVQEVLYEFDLRFDHVLSFTVYLTDISLKEEFLSVFTNFLEAPYPSATIVEVSALDTEDAMICIAGSGVNTLRHERSMKDAYCEDCDR